MSSIIMYNAYITPGAAILCSAGLSQNSIPVLVGGAEGSSGHIISWAMYNGDKNSLYVVAGGDGFSGNIKMYYLYIS